MNYSYQKIRKLYIKSDVIGKWMTCIGNVAVCDERPSLTCGLVVFRREHRGDSEQMGRPLLEVLIYVNKTGKCVSSSYMKGSAP